MNRRVWSIVAAVALGVVGTLVMIAYVHGAEDRALAGEKVVKVLVASQTIKAGTAGEDLGSSVKSERIPAKVRAVGALGSLHDLQGLVAAVDIPAGEQLMLVRFVSPDKVDKGVGVIRVPQGLLEATVSLEPDRALGGQVKPGDRVAVFASFDETDGGSNTTGIILHKVLVTNVQIDQQYDKPDSPSKAPSHNLLVTLAGSPTDLERLTFGAEHGHLWLASEPPSATETPVPVITANAVFGS